jgi:PAS domain S-box-containing protein
VHRLLSVLGAVLVVAFGPLYAVSNPDAVDPLWARLGIASLLFALLGASYGSPHVRKAYTMYLWGILYVLMGWFVVIATLNQFAGDYAVGLLLVYAVLTMVIAFGATSVQSVLWFLGYGGLLTAGSIMGTPSRTSPLIVLASMGTIALVESTLTQGWLWIRETVREQESRLRGLTNSLPGVVFQFYARDDGTVGHYFVSEHAEDVLGIDPDPDTFHERCLECIPAPDREAMERSIQEAIEQETAWEFETPFQRPDGERIWALGASTPERRDGEVVFNGVILDITARKEAEQALREERDRFETLFETLPTPVVRCVTEADGTFVTDVNPAFEEVFGLAAPEAVGAEVNQLLVPQEGETRARAFDQRILEEGFVQAEVQRTTADGVRDFQVKAALRQPEAGPPEIYAIYTDITERKQRERRLDAIFNQTYQFTGLMEPDGTMIEANDTALQFGGLDRADVVGKPLWETHWAQTGEESKRKLQDAIQQAAEGEFVRYERPIQGVEEERVIDFSIRPITDEDGTVELLIPEARDITELKRREQKLREAKEEAEEASRLKSAVLANMSHELRTPLTSIIGFAEAIHEEEEGDGTVAHFASLIEKSGERLLRTFENVLNLSRLEAEREEGDVEPVDVASQVRSVAEELRDRAAEAGVSVHTEDLDTAVFALARTDDLQIVLRHLLSNAIKYTQSEGDVWVRVDGAGGTATVEIEDTGIGMDPDEVPELFEPFRQASEGLDREYEGTGLGLSVVQRAVDRMQGSIDVETEEGEGTCVTVELPKAEPAGEEDISSEA